MMLRKTVPSLLATVGLTMIAGGCLPSAFAQQAAAPPANPFANLSIPPSLFFGFLGPMSGIVDPTHSAAMQLLQRSDVQNELGVDLNQVSALKALQEKSQQEVRVKLTTVGQDAAKSFQGLPQDQIQGQIQDTLSSVAATMQTMQGDIDKRTEGILRAKQISRLHQLDFQWRGPLALSDPKVAELLMLTADQKTKVSASLKEFTDMQQKAIMTVMMPVPNAKPAPPEDPPVSPQVQMQRKMSAAMHTREMDKAKKEVEVKLLDLLTPVQKEQWKIAQGAKYTFHKLDN